MVVKVKPVLARQRGSPDRSTSTNSYIMRFKLDGGGMLALSSKEGALHTPVAHTNTPVRCQGADNHIVSSPFVFHNPRLLVSFIIVKLISS